MRDENKFMAKSKFLYYFKKYLNKREQQTR